MKFLRDEEGQGMIEYALIIALIAVVAIVALRAIGKSVNAKLGNVNDALSGTATAPTNHS